jgi:hypothetical protein
VECGMWNVECGMWNVECGMWNLSGCVCVSAGARGPVALVSYAIKTKGQQRQLEYKIKHTRDEQVHCRDH